MEYVFGSTFVCDDADAAKRVTFDPAVRMKSVTLEGDLYDPAGTLSGGSAPHSSGVLVTLQKLNELTKELGRQEIALVSLRDTMAKEKKKLDSARKAKQELDLKTHEIKLTEEQIGGNSSSSVCCMRRIRLHTDLTDYPSIRGDEGKRCRTQEPSDGSQKATG